MDEHKMENEKEEPQEPKNVLCVYCHLPIDDEIYYPMEVFGTVQRTCMHPLHKQCIQRVKANKFRNERKCPVCSF